MISLLAALLLATALPAQTTSAPQPRRYAGAAACGNCHPAQFSQQSASGHARSLVPAQQHPLAARFFPETPLVRKPNFRFEFTPGKVRVSGKDAAALEAPIQWAFGAGDQAVTFVGRLDEDRYLEHHFSYYAAVRTLDATPGHRDLPAQSPAEALGLIYRTFDPEARIMTCFQCHSTGRLSLGPELEIQPAELGVRCEACHGPGSLHVEAASQGRLAETRRLIDNPRRLPAAALNQLCGQCHRKPAPSGAATDWNDPWNARHQPLYLSQSACFRRSAGKLSCLTCHHPHRPLQRNDAAYYNARCGACHQAVKHPPLKLPAGNCIRCHMPEVRPHEHLRFANHWIGVYRGKDTLRPR